MINVFSSQRPYGSLEIPSGFPEGRGGFMLQFIFFSTYIFSAITQEIH